MPGNRRRDVEVEARIVAFERECEVGVEQIALGATLEKTAVDDEQVVGRQIDVEVRVVFDDELAAVDDDALHRGRLVEHDGFASVDYNGVVAAGCVSVPDVLRPAGHCVGDDGRI